MAMGDSPSLFNHKMAKTRLYKKLLKKKLRKRSLKVKQSCDHSKRTGSYSEAHLLKQIVIRHSQEISDWLDFESLIPKFVQFSFLTSNEITHISSLPTPRRQANRVIIALKKHQPIACRNFVACLLTEHEHLGHKDLVTCLIEDKQMPPLELGKIRELVKQSVPEEGGTTLETECTDLCKDGPARAMPLIELCDDLNSPDFAKLDRKLWISFSIGEYNTLARLTAKVVSDKDSPFDWKVIARWFQGLLAAHRDHKYQKSIDEHLIPALELFDEVSSPNENILKGRILQRISQVYLDMGRKEMASTYYCRAKELLQHVARGYDKANLFCREAKLMSATTPEKRQDIEMMYVYALQAFSEEDPFYLASYPSICLSKAAFHLHISFGSKPQPQRPALTSDDTSKAKAILKVLPEDMIYLEKRKSELKLLKAELFRISGEPAKALPLFKELIHQSKHTNVVAHAKNYSILAKQNWKEYTALNKDENTDTCIQ